MFRVFTKLWPDMVLTAARMSAWCLLVMLFRYSGTTRLFTDGLWILWHPWHVEETLRELRPGLTEDSITSVVRFLQRVIVFHAEARVSTKAMFSNRHGRRRVLRTEADTNLPQQRGEVKSAVEERWTSEELRLSENDSDSHYPLIVQMSPLEMPSSDLRKRSAEASAKRTEKKSNRSWTKARDPNP